MAWLSTLLLASREENIQKGPKAAAAEAGARLLTAGGATAWAVELQTNLREVYSLAITEKAPTKTRT